MRCAAPPEQVRKEMEAAGASPSAVDASAAEEATYKWVLHPPPSSLRQHATPLPRCCCRASLPAGSQLTASGRAVAAGSRLLA